MWLLILSLLFDVNECKTFEENNEWYESWWFWISISLIIITYIISITMIIRLYRTVEDLHEEHHEDDDVL